MLQLDVITLFPELIETALRHGLIGQAFEKDILKLKTLNPREMTNDRHRTVDDRPFGGGDGMIMLAEPLEKSIQSLRSNDSYVVYLSPQGKTLTDAKARELSQRKHLIFVCGRYGGIDQRVINTQIDEEISIGDYVLAGGEVAALVVIEALARFIPGVLGHGESPDKDSFAEGLLEEPAFTRPREYENQAVPAVLLSGNHAHIQAWKKTVSALVTLEKRPDLYHKISSELEKDLQLSALWKFYSELSGPERESLGLSLEKEDFRV